MTNVPDCIGRCQVDKDLLSSSKTAPLRHQCLRWPYWNVPARRGSHLWTISGLRYEYKPWSTSLSDMSDLRPEVRRRRVWLHLFLGHVQVHGQVLRPEVRRGRIWPHFFKDACKCLCYRCCSCCASFSIGSAGDLEVSFGDWLGGVSRA